MKKDYNPYKKDKLTPEERELDSKYVNWFSITALQAKAAGEFNKDHFPCQRGAIGGAVTYEFSSTSLGQIFKARCSCGSEADFTDYLSW